MGWKDKIISGVSGGWKDRVVETEESVPDFVSYAPPETPPVPAEMTEQVGSSGHTISGPAAVVSGWSDVVSHGWDDEIAGALGADRERLLADRERLGEEYPVQSLAGNALGAATLAAALPMTIPAMAVSGALQGAGTSDTTDRVTGAVGGAIGGVLGAGAGRMLRGGAQAAGNLATRAGEYVRSTAPLVGGLLGYEAIRNPSGIVDNLGTAAKAGAGAAALFGAGRLLRSTPMTSVWNAVERAGVPARLVTSVENAVNATARMGASVAGSRAVRALLEAFSDSPERGAAAHQTQMETNPEYRNQYRTVNGR